MNLFVSFSHSSKCGCDFLIFSSFISPFFRFTGCSDKIHEKLFPHSALLKMWKTFCRKSAISAVFSVDNLFLSTSFQHLSLGYEHRAWRSKKIYFSVIWPKKPYLHFYTLFFTNPISALHFQSFEFAKNTNSSRSSALFAAFCAI